MQPSQQGAPETSTTQSIEGRPLFCLWACPPQIAMSVLYFRCRLEGFQGRKELEKLVRGVKHTRDQMQWRLPRVLLDVMPTPKLQ